MSKKFTQYLSGYVIAYCEVCDLAPWVEDVPRCNEGCPNCGAPLSFESEDDSDLNGARYRAVFWTDEFGILTKSEIHSLDVSEEEY